MHDRRQFLKTAGLGAMARSGCALVKERETMNAETGAAGRPNILVIHVDQQRIDTLGAYGNPDVKSPHVDALARDGVRYENSFCSYPACTPSRYSLLSGLSVHEHRGWSNRSTLAPEIETFPRILRAAGYQTKAVGKMHFLPTYLDVGFDELELAEQDGPGRWDDDYHRELMERGLVDRIDIEDQRGEYRKHAPQAYWDTFGAQVSDLPEKHHSTTWIADRAIDDIKTWDTKGGRLLMAGFIKPHHPFDPPAPWHEMYDPDKLTVLPGWTEECLERDLKFSRGYFPHEKLTEKSLRRAMAYYYATISQIDHHVGRMVEALKKKGLYENTLIVYTSDHGDYLGFHHLLLKGNLMYDPVSKVPLIVKWPGNPRAGEVSKQLMNNTDLAPTICRAAGLKPASSMHGRDLLTDRKGHEIVFSESSMGQHLMARTQTRKLILVTDQRKAMKVFIDLEKDPLEMNNVYDDPAYAAEAKKLEAALTKWLGPGPHTTHRDENSPKIDRPNVPPHDLSHRPAIIEYHEKKMKALQGS